MQSIHSPQKAKHKRPLSKVSSSLAVAMLPVMLGLLPFAVFAQGTGDDLDAESIVSISNTAVGTFTVRLPDTPQGVLFEQRSTTFAQLSNTFARPKSTFSQPKSTFSRPKSTFAQLNNTFEQSSNTFEEPSNTVVINARPSLGDAFGRVVACDGLPLDSYVGYSAALYNAAGALSTDIDSLVDLPPNNSDPSFPSFLRNSIVAGPGFFNVNPDNDNPFDIGTTELGAINNPDSRDILRGRYSFLLRADQLQLGDTYILVIDVPEGTGFGDRLIQVEITDPVSGTGDDAFAFTVRSLDGQRLNAGEANSTSAEVVVPIGTRRINDNSLFVFGATALSICEAAPIDITKTGDRSSVSPGGFIVYRLGISNNTDVDIENVIISDFLPRGFVLNDESVRGGIQGEEVEVVVSGSGSSVEFEFQEPIPPGTNVAEVVYVTQVTPDAIRGSGRNSAVIDGDRADNGFPVSDGPVSYQVTISEGLFSDAGTIIGRVFVDLNADGQHQEGEGTLADAVIFMQNGDRIVTDENGLFSLANVLPGWYVGVLDLTSVPGYQPAPNDYVLAEDRRYSRAVQLEPGGMVRMNFAVTPYTGEEAQ